MIKITKTKTSGFEAAMECRVVQDRGQGMAIGEIFNFIVKKIKKLLAKWR